MEEKGYFSNVHLYMLQTDLHMFFFIRVSSILSYQQKILIKNNDGEINLLKVLKICPILHLEVKNKKKKKAKRDNWQNSRCLRKNPGVESEESLHA